MLSQGLMEKPGHFVLGCVLATVATVAVRLAELNEPRLDSASWFLVLATPLCAGAVRWILVRRRESSWLLWLLLSASLLEPIVSELVRRTVFHIGSSPEFMLLEGLRNIMWVLLVAAYSRRNFQLSMFIAGALVLFTGVISDHAISAMLTVLFGGLLGAWLVSMHVASGGLQASTVLQATCACILICLPGFWMSDQAARAARALAGFLPFSGGTSWNDPWASDGVGDGEQLVAATASADSTGPIDSKRMLSSHRPSLYDVFDDMYGEPQKMREKQDRAVALALRPQSDTQREVADSEHAGKEFTTARESRKKERRKLADVEAVGLMYVAGPTPVHLRLAVYEDFDGARWKEAAAPAIAQPHFAQPTSNNWFHLHGRNPDPGVVDRYQIKIGTIATHRIPAPARLTAVRLGEVNRADFFRWDQPDVLAVDRASLPGGTLLEVECLTGGIDSGSQASSDWPTPEQLQQSSRGVPLLTASVSALLDEWMAGTQRGWQQVAQLARNLSRHCELDAESTGAPGDRNLLEHFLVIRRRGPDYLFATAAAVLLRHLGYETRLVSGFYGSDENYLSSSRQLVLTQQDVHFWLEVLDAQGSWIPVEVTPGYRLRIPTMPWSAWLTHSFSSLCEFSISQWRVTAALFVVCPLIWATRREILDWAATTAWRVAIHRRFEHGVGATLRLLEFRARLVGAPRPRGQTVRGWLKSLPFEEPASAAVDYFVSIFEIDFYGQTSRTADQVAADLPHLRLVIGTATRRFIRSSAASPVTISDRSMSAEAMPAHVLSPAMLKG